MPKDIVITWPKKRSLNSYLVELENAERDGCVINFRVPTLPKGKAERCYVVHDGAIRGYNLIVSIERQENYMVLDPLTGEYWPSGNYIVRWPKWHDIEPIPMKGFQGYRYIERPKKPIPKGCWEEE